MTNPYSEAAADRIKQATLAALQDADEIGGPDFPEYIELMRSLAAECERRAQVAEDVARGDVLIHVKRKIPTAEIAETGGGCTAIHIPDGEDGAHWLITSTDGATVPHSFEDGPVILGHYSDAGETTHTTQYASTRDAVALLLAAYLKPTEEA